MRNYITRYLIIACEYILYLLKRNKEEKMDITYLINAIVDKNVCSQLDPNQYIDVSVNDNEDLKSLLYIFNFKNLKTIEIRIEYKNGVLDFQFVSTSFIELDIFSEQLYIINRSLNNCKNELTANFKIYDNLA